MGELKPGGLISSLAEGQWSALVLGFGNSQGFRTCGHDNNPRQRGLLGTGTKTRGHNGVAQRHHSKNNIRLFVHAPSVYPMWF